jgi:hypothetical protein
MAKMERLLADNREMKADKEEMMARMDNNKEEMIKAIMGASQESTEACEDKMDAWLGKTEACGEVTRLFGGREGTNSKRDRVGGGSAGSPQGSN